MKRIKILALAALFLLTSLFGFACNDGGGGDKDTPSKRAGTLNIMMFDGGYGIDFMKKLAGDYKKKNPRVTINVKKTATPANELDKIAAGTATCDIYFMIDNMFKQVDNKKLADISDVMNYIEPGQDKKVSEKMNPNYVTPFLMDDGKYYMMPWSNSQEGLVYNKTSVDKYFPGGLQIPRTSNEMIEVFEIIKAKGVEKNANLIPFLYSGQDDYLPFLFMPWWAQYDGVDSVSAFYEGSYIDENGNKVFSKDGRIGYTKGREYTWSALEQLCKKSNKYTHPNTDSLTRDTMQYVFYGQGYNGDKSESFFSLNGEWLEEEASIPLASKHEEARFAKTPILSNVIDKTPSIKNDAKLREVVDYCDKITTVKPSGVTDKDIAYIDSCRRMVNSVGQDHNLGVVSSSKVIPLAKDFLKFLTTAEAGKNFSKYLKGLSLPYGAYDPLKDETLVMSDFIKSRYTATENCIPVYQARRPIITYRGGLNAYRYKQGVKLFDETKSGADYYLENAEWIEKDWKNICKRAGLSDLLN